MLSVSYTLLRHINIYMPYQDKYLIIQNKPCALVSVPECMVNKRNSTLSGYNVLIAIRKLLRNIYFVVMSYEFR